MKHKIIKKNKKGQRRKGARHPDNDWFRKLADGLIRTCTQLEKKLHQHSVKLKLKDGQLKEEQEKQRLAQAQIHVRDQALESTSDGIFIIDAQKTVFPIIYANPSFHKMSGYNLKDVLGKAYLSLYGDGREEHIVESIRQAIIQGISFQADVQSVRKNGEKFWIMLRIAPVRDATGTVTHFVGIQTDTTLMRQKEIELEAQRDELLHISRVGKLAELISSLAHEINQPLAAILSYTQAAQRMLSDREPKLQEILSYIVKDDRRAADVIQRLRVMLKKQKPKLESFDINALIHETVSLVNTDAMIRSKVIKIDLAENLPPIHGDRIQLQQVLLNLISNGLEAMEHDKTSSEILISAQLKDSEAVIVKVKDSGKGISAQNMHKLFVHFFTTKAEGLGMGLAISRSIVEAHGGSLIAENNPDRGATFSFTVPLGKKDAPVYS